MTPIGYNLSIEALGAAQQAEEDHFVAARDAYPAWDIIETFGGYLAVPRGTVVLQATTVDGLVGKIRKQESA